MLLAHCRLERLVPFFIQFAKKHPKQSCILSGVAMSLLTHPRYYSGLCNVHGKKILPVQFLKSKDDASSSSISQAFEAVHPLSCLSGKLASGIIRDC